MATKVHSNLEVYLLQIVFNADKISNKMFDNDKLGIYERLMNTSTLENMP